MAYQTGVPVSETDLVQTLVAFLAAQGWTTNLSASDGSTGGWRAHMSKGGVYVNLRSMYQENGWGAFTGGAMNGVGMNVGTGFNGANAWNDQAGVPQYIASGPYPAGVQLSTQNNHVPTNSMRPFTRYHFFTDAADNVIVVLERASGNFGFLGWGGMVKSGGVWTGGLFCFGDTDVAAAASVQDTVTAACPGSNGGRFNDGPSLWVRADVDSYVGKYLANYGPTETVWGKMCATGVSQTSPIPPDIPSQLNLYQRLTSLLNAQAVLLPVNVFAHRDGGGYSLIGALPNVFLCNAGGIGFSSGSIYVIGASRYMIFQGQLPFSGGHAPGFAVEQFLI
jgi:hypothetical protein